jgi:small-conductance mechanosensitive channel
MPSRVRLPQIILTDFGNHAIHWEVAIWMHDPWTARPATSALHETIWNAFKKKRVVIAFPQLDVHFVPPVTARLASAASPAA